MGIQVSNVRLVILLGKYEYQQEIHKLLHKTMAQYHIEHPGNKWPFSTEQAVNY